MPPVKLYAEEMHKKKEKFHEAEKQPSEFLYKPPVEFKSTADIQKKEIQKMSKTQEEKLGTFIDEMRQNYLQ